MSFNTLHIFAYGQVQLITDKENKLVDSDLCPSVQAVIDMVYSHKPVDNPATTDYRNINIFYDMFADYMADSGDFRTEYAELDSVLINILAAEIQAA